MPETGSVDQIPAHHEELADHPDQHSSRNDHANQKAAEHQKAKKVFDLLLHSLLQVINPHGLGFENGFQSLDILLVLSATPHIGSNRLYALLRCHPMLLASLGEAIQAHRLAPGWGTLTVPLLLRIAVP